jgi:endogenous inhibitor of DNA gyrase (YacG/DUF329 family)
MAEALPVEHGDVVKRHCPECRDVLDETTYGYCSEWCRYVNDDRD